MTVSTCHSPRELARRVSGGIEVTLYWCAEDNSTSIEVWQPASEERLEFAIPGGQALDAFYHPFAHLALVADEAFPTPPLTLGRL